MTHISYEIARKLKEVLRKNAPKPMERMYFVYDDDSHQWEPRTILGISKFPPMYGVCDLVGQGFCKALAAKHPHCKALNKYAPIEDLAWDISRMIQEEYYNNGLPAVEKALCEMMEAK